ncbi:class III signal peptide-containing protein [Methanococcus aeolicus]|uniref:Class III signal peptide-containing protein n=1 Tax=Methanococcus aeolicus (strain ATCC BAA-1280 / DSM 17508 / OCM 812 / Nankai-3) TaxID=419665 RepID=A6UV75_META3|nr:class III signal peptide-containing protein [Methanococcus aeolicus]ABR56397.1 conserved hypothetical protein [Methanococcus aeolicus Nankai-3]UXM84395.1 class III signal peptide-containing protein [Methanococcus aeolicus]
MIKKIISKKAQISLEFGLLTFAVIVGATLVGYYMLKSAINVRDINMDTINKSSEITMNALSTVD